MSAVHIKHISPLPNGLDKAFEGFSRVFVVELNDEGLVGIGQLGALLRARYPKTQFDGVTKSDGLTWKVREILDRIRPATA